MDKKKIMRLPHEFLQKRPYLRQEKMILVNENPSKFEFIRDTTLLSEGRRAFPTMHDILEEEIVRDV